ncbi:MAG TPA: hypothetical protein VFY82_10370 [Acidimicrobiales bacterium]|nr:hypothetical protein [Acidimicrobiales bacterium]
MSATDLAAVIVAGCSVVAVVLLAVALASLVRTLRALRDVATVLRTETVPVLEDLRDTVEAANYEIIRLDGLVTTAESVTGTVDSASRLAYIAMANPVIKGVAFASGTAKAARRLRGRKVDDDPSTAPDDGPAGRGGTTRDDATVRNGAGQANGSGRIRGRGRGGR